MRLLIAALILLLPAVARAARSAAVVTPRDSVTLISQSNAAANGAVELALEFRLAPGWHIYWQNPGDAGFAPTVALAAPAVAGPLKFPPPSLLIQDGIVAYVLSGTVVLPFTAQGVAGNRVAATARWLVCRDVCVPEHGAFTLALPSGPAAEAAAFAGLAIVASPFAAQSAPDGTLTVAGLGPATVAAARFFPLTPGLIVNAAPQILRFSHRGLSLRLTLAPNQTVSAPLAGVLEITDRSGAVQALALTAAPGPAGAATPLIVLLALAWAGGLILNLMPCVLPVLALKVFQLLRHGRAAARRQALGYTGGILTAMVALGAVLLGLRGLGSAAGWGFQLQSPPAVALMALIVLGVTLNLAGGFEVPALPLGRLTGHGRSFFTGLLAVAVAAPCTAPFMAGAVAAALAGPAWAALTIFLALGLGLATPFLAIGFIPGLASLLPRPGRWMLLLQRLLAVPMAATFLWLAWVLWRQAAWPGVLILVAAGALLLVALLRPRSKALAVAALLLLPLLHGRATPVLTLPGAVPFSAEKLAALRAEGRPVLVDVTAAWCITCLVNEHTALAAPAVRRALAATRTQLLVADWTNRSAALAAYLQKNGRDGVPLAVLYEPGAPPQILPQILTPGTVLAALARP